MVLRLDRQFLTGFGSDPRQIAESVVAARPEGVLINLEAVRNADLPVERWIRAHPGATFPMVVFSRARREEWLAAEGAWLTDPHGPDRFCCVHDARPEDVLASLPLNPPCEKARLQVLNALIREYEPGFRHDFGNQVAAVRLLLGALRTGAVAEESARTLLRDLARGVPRLNEGPFWTLVTWWLDALATAGGDAPVLRLPPLRQSVLLVDDQAETAGWSRVLGAIFGPHNLVAVTHSAGARKKLNVRGFDLALIDLDLGAEDGIALITELRRRRFDLPLIAFSVHDRAAIALAALRAGADAYFAKEIADRADRESADYFRRFHRLVSALPGCGHPARLAWRSFQKIETRLDAFDAARPRNHASLTTAAFFRLAWFFVTAPRADAEGNPLRDVRYRTFFGEPDLAGCLCLNMALKLFSVRAVGRANIKQPTCAVPILRRQLGDKLKPEEWDALIELAHGDWRHKLQFRTAPELSGWMVPLVHLFKAQLDADCVPTPPEPVATLEVEPWLRTTVRRESATHSGRRAAAFQTLHDGLAGVPPLDHGCPVLLVDDQPREWMELLPRLCQASPQVIDPTGDAAAVVRSIVEHPGSTPLLILDLDWHGDAGRAALEVLLQLKSRRPWIPVLVASALDDSLSLHRALYSGASGYFLLEPGQDASAYALRLRTVLARLARLINPNYPLERIWTEMEQTGEALRLAFPKSADLCLDALRLAVFCSWPDYNPAEVCRHRRLLDVVDAQPSLLLHRLFYVMATRPVEELWVQPPGVYDQEYAALERARGYALGQEKEKLAEFDNLGPADFLHRTMTMLRRLCPPAVPRPRGGTP